MTGTYQRHCMHVGPTKNGKVIWGGGLLSLLKTQDTGYYFDVSDPYRPKFLKSDRATLASIADEVRAKPDGGFVCTTDSLCPIATDLC